MDFARQQRDPTRHAIGITVVVLMHALLIYLLVTGLGRTVVEVIKKPLTATIIEEIKAPPPPPPPPPQPYTIAPPAPVVEAPPPKPAIRRGIARLAGDNPEYPRQAIRAGIEKGKVVARLMIDEKGNVTDVVIVSADPPRVFDRAVTEALKTWKFQGEGEKYVGEIEVNFALKE